MSDKENRLQEQKEIVSDVSKMMMEVGKQAMIRYIESKKLTHREAISLMADIATEVYLQNLSDLAFIGRGNDSKTKKFLKDNNAIARRKVTTLYDLKAKQRDEVIAKHESKPKLHRV